MLWWVNPLTWCYVHLRFAPLAQSGIWVLIVQVLHCRGCSGTGLGLLYLVATCYLMFTTQFRHHSKALAALYPIRLQHVGGSINASLARRWSGFQCLRSKPSRACHKLRIGLSCRDVGAAQQRYCNYFERTLYTLPPRALRLVLRHVLFGSLEAVVAKGGSKYGPLLHQSRLSQHSVRPLASNICIQVAAQ